MSKQSCGGRKLLRKEVTKLKLRNLPFETYLEFLEFYSVWSLCPDYWHGPKDELNLIELIYSLINNLFAPMTSYMSKVYKL